MSRTSVFNEQAAYCTYLLRRVIDPRRRALIERERQDWLTLAYEANLRAELEAQPGAQPRSFAADRHELDLQDS